MPVAVQGLEPQAGLLEQRGELVAQEVAVEQAPLQRFAAPARDVLVGDVELLAGAFPATPLEDVVASAFELDSAAC